MTSATAYVYHPSRICGVGMILFFRSCFKNAFTASERDMICGREYYEYVLCRTFLFVFRERYEKAHVSFEVFDFRIHFRAARWC